MQTQTNLYLKPKNSYIETYSGKRFYFLDPDPESIDIVDIAHSLSMQCRFTGHTKKFYSIAEHSIIVSRMCTDENKLWGLLHDASEAYLADISSPVKPHLTNYKLMEEVIMKSISEKFELPKYPSQEIKEADLSALRQEAFCLMKSRGEGWIVNKNHTNNISTELISCYHPEEAKIKFLEEFKKLTNGKI